MASAIAERLMTAEEFAETTDPPGMRTELVRGRVIYMPPPANIHGEYVANTILSLGPFARAHDLGRVMAESGYTLQRRPDTVRGPDVSFVSHERLRTQGHGPSYLEGAPTLAVEVISPSETRADVADKVSQYLAAGAERVWEVRPRQRTVTVHRSGSPAVTKHVGDVLTSDDAAFAVDGFALAVEAIFA